MSYSGVRVMRQITEYELLISCPSDVREEAGVINETVDLFNQSIGKINNAKIVTRHWSKDAYPQLGGTPQKILNSQFVLQCDAAVAVFWTRFGTPTEDYDSGTEEEIEELIKSGKQVFLYFSDCAVNPSQIDHTQYEKVKGFRLRYADRGYYGTYSSLDEFRKDFFNHLMLYFGNLLNGEKEPTLNKYKSNLYLKGVVDNKLEDYAVSFQTHYSESKYINDLKTKTIELINQINAINLPEPITKNIQENINIEDNDENRLPNISAIVQSIDFKKLSESWTSGIVVTPVEIAKEYKDKINLFAGDNDIILSQGFYYLGELTRQKSKFGTILGSSSSLKGSDEEKEKFELILKLEKSLDGYLASLKYFLEIDNKLFVNLALCNFGKDFDEDIDIKMYFEKGFLTLLQDLPFPDYQCIDMSIETFEYFYKPAKTVIIDEYQYYHIIPSLPRIDTTHYMFTGGKTLEQKIKEKANDFNIKRDKIFPYEIFSNDEYEVLGYNQKYLKQNTNSFLPSYLVFNKKPGMIRYEITAKRSPDIIKGELVIN